MKKVLIIIILLELIVFINPNNYLNCTSYANNNQNKETMQNQNEIINVQKDNLNISNFMKEAEKYTKTSMPGLDLNNLLSTAISGNIDNVKLMKLIFRFIRKRGFKLCCNFKQHNCYSSNSFNIKKHK